MPKFEFTKTCGYIRPRNAGEISELPDVDCDNAAAIGLGHRVADETTAGADVPVVSPEPSEPNSLACERGCNGGKPFGSVAALASHKYQKHNQK